MDHRIQIVDFNEPIRLENSQIDNRDGQLTISLKSVDYWVGYYNVRKNVRILRQIINRGGDATESYQFIEPGFTGVVYKGQYMVS